MSDIVIAIDYIYPLVMHHIESVINVLKFTNRPEKLLLNILWTIEDPSKFATNSLINFVQSMYLRHNPFLVMLHWLVSGLFHSLFDRVVNVKFHWQSIYLIENNQALDIFFLVGNSHGLK